MPGLSDRASFNEESLLSPRAAVHQVFHGCFIAATEAFAVVCAGASGNVRMAVLITIADVGSAMVVVVPSRALDSVVESLPLDVAKFLWRHVPVPIMVAVLVLGGRSGRSERLSYGEAGRCQSKSESWSY
jgi:hypothetical protein